MEPVIYPSPDENFTLEISSIPMRMSHEVDSPTLVETASRKVIFDPGSLWDGSDIRWSEDSKRLSMYMRHYSNGSRGFTLELDLEQDRATLSGDTGALFTGRISEVQKAMEQVDDIRKALARR